MTTTGLRVWSAEHRSPIAAACGLVVPLVVSASLYPARGSFDGPAAALVLVAVLSAVAILGTRLAGILGSLSAGIWFDFFLTRPYDRLAISHRGDIETTVSLFVVGLIVTELAARSRHHRAVAAEEGDFVALIHELGSMVALGEKAASVTERAGQELKSLLQLKECSFVSGDSVSHRATVMPDGRVVHGGVIWGVAALGLPGPEVDLPVHYAGKTLGRFVLVPTPGVPVSAERMIVAVAIAGQAGAGMATRARIA